MGQRVDTLDLSSLQMSTGEGRRLRLGVALGELELGGEVYRTEPEVTEAQLDLSRTSSHGYALRLRFDVALVGPCMRCLGDAAPAFAIDAREVSQPGAGEQLDSPYVSDSVPVMLRVGDWARDALALALPAPVLCRSDCLGLCSVCGADLNQAGPDHAHEPAPDPRWAKLSQLRLDR